MGSTVTFVCDTNARFVEFTTEELPTVEQPGNTSWKYPTGQYKGSGCKKSGICYEIE